MKLFYSSDFACDGYGVDTKEKARDIIASLDCRPIGGVEVVAPDPVTKEQLLTTHDPRYVRGVLTGLPESWAERNGLGEWSRRLRDSVLATTGGVIASAVHSYITRENSGSASSGIHHAKRATGSGFCTFNGLVIAARELLRLGARRVLILDLDAHCGGGTASLINGVAGVEQVDVSVNYFDHYNEIENAVLVVSNGDSYLADIEAALNAIVDVNSIDVVLYNAGMDPHERCSTGGEAGITTDVLAQREQIVFEWAHQHGIPVSFVFAGGYSGRQLSRSEVVDLHRLTIEEAWNSNFTEKC